MTDMLDLLEIAKTEASGGDLRGLLEGLFEPSEVRPVGYPDAPILQGGNHDGIARTIEKNSV